LRVRDDVVERNALDGLAHQFPHAFGERAAEDEIGTAFAVEPLAFQRRSFFEIGRSAVEDRGAFLEHPKALHPPQNLRQAGKHMLNAP
jgi:hypothetical protein